AATITRRGSPRIPFSGGRLCSLRDRCPQRRVLGLAGLEQQPAYLLGQLGVLGDVGAGLVAPLGDPLAAEGVEGARLFEQAGGRGEVDDLARGVDADAVEDV